MAPSGGRCWLGLISGTSVDTIDAAIVRFDPEGDDGTTPHLVAAHAHPIAPDLRRKLLETATSPETPLRRVARLDAEVGHLFAEAALKALAASGLKARDITAIGSHGQTVRHEPRERPPFTVQIGDPNIIAERTGITTVADFRRRDLAAGGEGAPLAPAFHDAVLAHPSRHRVIVNLGGIANLSLLPPRNERHGSAQSATRGFDSGPANGLMDAWTRRHLGDLFDRDGDWARSGKIHGLLLARMRSDSYFEEPPPKSTGLEHFDEYWIDQHLDALGADAAEPDPADVQRTLCELSAITVAEAVLVHAPAQAEVYVCGGGVHNRLLMERLGEHLAPRAPVSTEALGVSPDYMEAMTFAWLAMRTLDALPGNLPSVTGAAREVVLGGIWPGGGGTPSANES